MLEQEPSKRDFQSTRDNEYPTNLRVGTPLPDITSVMVTSFALFTIPLDNLFWYEP